MLVSTPPSAMTQKRLFEKLSPIVGAVQKDRLFDAAIIGVPILPTV